MERIEEIKGKYQKSSPRMLNFSQWWMMCDEVEYLLTALAEKDKVIAQLHADLDVQDLRDYRSFPTWAELDEWQTRAEQAEARARELEEKFEQARKLYLERIESGKILESRLSTAREGLEGIILKTKGWRVSSYDEAGKFTGSVACDGCKISNDIAEQTLERME